MTKAERQNEWETRIAEYQASGLSVIAWCAAHDLKLHQLRYWLRKYKDAELRTTMSSRYLTNLKSCSGSTTVSGFIIDAWSAGNFSGQIRPVQR